MPRSRWLPSRIESRFLLLTLPALVAAFVLYCTVSLSLRSEELQRQRRDSAQQLARNEAQLLSQPLWQLEAPMLRALLDRSAGAAGVRCAELIESSGLLLELRAGPCDGMADIIEAPITRIDGDALRTIGRLRLQVTTEVSWTELMADAKPLLQLLVVLIGALSLSLAWAFRRIVMRPLHRVSASLRAGGSQGSRQPVDWQARDELGEFIAEYNASLAREQHFAEQLQQSNADLTALGVIGRELAATLDQEQTFLRVHQQVAALLDAHVFLIGLLDHERECVHVAFAVEGVTRVPPVDFSLAETARPAVWCVRNAHELVAAEPQVIAALLGIVLPAKIGEAMASVVYLPLQVGARVIGCLSVQSPRSHAYSERQLDFLRSLSAHTAIAVANAQSYARLKKAMEQLREAQQKLLVSEKMAVAGQLTAGVAHEINNPNNFAYVAAQNLDWQLRTFHAFLLKLAGPDLEPEVAQAIAHRIAELAAQVDTILEGSRRISSIVQDLRAFSRLDEAEQKPVSVVESLRATLNLVRAQYHQRIEISLDARADPALDCNPARLNQVFMNLIVNACQAIEEKSRHAGPGYRGELRVCTQALDDELLICFEDNGCGMDDEVRRHIFEPFFTTKSVGQGTGLGLPVSWGIVTEHHGRIEVESAPGVGTRMRVHLPLRLL